MFKQVLIPGFPHGAQRIGEALSILEKDGRATYFVGGDNCFSHPLNDKSGRRYALACLMENGHVRAVEIEGGHRHRRRARGDLQAGGRAGLERRVQAIDAAVAVEVDRVGARRRARARCARREARG